MIVASGPVAANRPAGAGQARHGGGAAARVLVTADSVTANSVTATAAARSAFPDWRFAPNIGHSPAVYEIENEALDRAGHVLDAMRELAPWAGKTIIDLGCGTGYWLPRYAAEADRVIGIEPDPALRSRAADRTAGLSLVEVRPGSAEHLDLPARSAEVVHARFAYFFAPGADAGLAEVLRVLRPGGSLVVVANDRRWGQFADLLSAASADPPQRTAAAVDAWWRERGATRHEVRSRLQFARRADLAAVLRIELPGQVADSWLARHPAATGLSYGFVLFRLTC